MSTADAPQQPDEVRAYLHERGYDIVMRGPGENPTLTPVQNPTRHSYRPRRHISYYETHFLTGDARQRRRRTWLGRLIHKGG